MKKKKNHKKQRNFDNERNGVTFVRQCVSIKKRTMEDVTAEHADHHVAPSDDMKNSDAILPPKIDSLKTKEQPGINNNNAADKVTEVTEIKMTNGDAQDDLKDAVLQNGDDSAHEEEDVLMTSSSYSSSTQNEEGERNDDEPNTDAVFTECPEVLLEIQKMNLVEAIQNNRRMKRSVSLTTTSIHAPHALHDAPSPASPTFDVTGSASNGTNSPSTNGAISPRNGATSPDSGINIETSPEPNNPETPRSTGRGMSNEEKDKMVSDAEKERQDFIKSQIVRRRRSDVLPYTQALPTEERLAQEKQKANDKMASSQRKYSLANKKNMWERIVEEESAKARQTYHPPTQKPVGLKRTVSWQPNSPAPSSNAAPNEIHRESNEKSKQTINKLSQNAAAQRFKNLDNKSAAASGSFQYTEREGATARIQREIAEQKARENELRCLGRIESLSDDSVDNMPIVSVSRCMSQNEDEDARAQNDVTLLAHGELTTNGVPTEL